VRLRHLLCWKAVFYDAVLPALRVLGPGASDAVLAGMGRLAAAWPPKRRSLEGALARASAVLQADWDVTATRRALAMNSARFQARDYLLDISADQALARFDVRGFEHVESAMGRGHGVIVLGSHLGAYLAGLHWMLRRGVALRLLVQRPRHLSAAFRRLLDRHEGPHPQSSFFLKRGLPPAEAAVRMLRARDALRDGLAVYFSGDVPWSFINARPGRLLGKERTFLSVWADLAVVARSPVVPMFCTHRAGGRFALAFDPPWEIPPGGQATAVTRFLARLEAAIVAHPADAIAHLTWPCYQEQAGDNGVVTPQKDDLDSLPSRLLQFPQSDCRS
jgi:lauroyl/myristoyl acyltransferase